MKFVILTCLCFISLEFCQGAEEINLSNIFQRELPEGATSERCNRLSDFVTKALAEVKKTYSPAITAHVLKQESASLGFDVNSESVRRPVLCKIADAKNLRELFEALPGNITQENYDIFMHSYKRETKQVVTIGGYTNVERIIRSIQDAQKWTDQLKPGKNLKEMTDLASLTDFLNIMQVKYGSRWLAAPLYVENQNLLIEDPEDFAKKLYDCETAQDVMTAFNLDERRAYGLLSIMKGYAGDQLPPRGITDIFIEGANLLGDMGFLNLKP